MKKFSTPDHLTEEWVSKVLNKITGITEETSGVVLYEVLKWFEEVLLDKEFTVCDSFLSRVLLEEEKAFEHLEIGYSLLVSSYPYRGSLSMWRPLFDAYEAMLLETYSREHVDLFVGFKEK